MNAICNIPLMKFRLYRTEPFLVNYISESKKIATENNTEITYLVDKVSGRLTDKWIYFYIFFFFMYLEISEVCYNTVL